jgi:diacylglycerol kinase family enzyme
MIQVPHAVADDGLYSITLIKKMGKLNILANVKRLYNGSIVNHSRVETYMGQSVQIEGSSLLQVETDGETLGEGPLSFKIIPRSVMIISGEMSA